MEAKYLKYKRKYLDLKSQSQNAGKYTCNYPGRSNKEKCWNSLQVKLKNGEITDKNKLKGTIFPDDFMFTDITLDGFDLSGADLQDIEAPNFQGARFINLSGSSPLLPDRYSFVTNSKTGKSFILGPNLNLSNLDLSYTDLSNVMLGTANLTNLKAISLTGTSPYLPKGYGYVTNTQTRQNYIVGPNMDLSNLDLSHTNLNHVDFTNSNVSGTNFTNAKFNITKCTNLLITGSMPILDTNSNLVCMKDSDDNYFIMGDNMNLSGINLSNVDFTKFGPTASQYPGLKNVVMENCKLTNAKFGKFKLEGVNLRNSNLDGAKLVKANITNVDLSRSSLKNALFYKAISETTYTTSQLKDVALDYCDLTGAKLKKLDLISTSLYLANLNGADLSGAKLFTPTIYKTPGMPPEKYGALMDYGYETLQDRCTDIDTAKDYCGFIVISHDDSGRPKHIPDNVLLVSDYQHKDFSYPDDDDEEDEDDEEPLPSESDVCSWTPDETDSYLTYQGLPYTEKKVDLLIEKDMLNIYDNFGILCKHQCTLYKNNPGKSSLKEYKY